MSLVQSQTMIHATLPASPCLPEFETDTAILHDVKYLTALEEEHSRDLYLQGAMAVGQIARLLEELCGHETSEDAQEIEDDFAVIPFEEVYQSRFISYDTKGSIEAWAHAVEPADDPEDDMPYESESEAEFDAQEDGEQTYLRGAFVVGDIADILEDLVNGLPDEHHDAQTPYPNLQKVATTQLIERTSETPILDIAARIANLSARLNTLEVDIDEFSKERCDALSRLELELAVEDVDDEVCGNTGYEFKYGVDGLGFSLPLEHEEDYDHRITRVWTTTATGTSGFSLPTPSESEAEPLELEPLKPEGYFWNRI